MAGRRGAEAAGAIFGGPDEISSLCRSVDWSATALGAIEAWPESLLPVIRTCLGASTIPMAIWIGPERIFLYNEAYAPLLGSARHPWALGHPARAVWPELWDRLGPMLERVIEQGESIRCDDHRFWLDQDSPDDALFACSFAPIRGAEDEIVGALSVLQATGGPRSASQQQTVLEESLRISEARLKFAQEAAGAGMWHWDLVTGELDWSDQLYRIFGWDPATSPPVTLDAWRAALHPDDRVRAETNLQRALTHGTPVVNEDRIVLPSGEIRWVNALGRTTYGADGTPLYVSGICVDITERKRTEESLRISEEKFARAFYGSTAAMTLARVDDGRLLEVNDRFVEVSGFAREQSVGRTTAELRIWKRPEDQEQFVARLRRDGKVRGEYDFVRPTGETWTGVVSAQLLQLAGQPTGISSIIDITSRREAEEALRASEAIARAHLVELEAIYETAPIGLCVFDEQLRWTRLNRIIAEINGRTIEEHIGRTPSDIVPDVGAQAEEALRTILRTGERLDFEMRGTTAAQPGVERVWSEHWVPMKEPDGRIVGISVAAEEITERKRAAEALAASEERFRTLAENAPEAISRYDQDMRFTYINAYGARLFGLRPADIVGRTVAEIETDPERVAFWRAQFDAVAKSGEHRTVDVEFDSPVFGHQCLSVVLVAERSEPLSILAITRDITPLKKVEQSLRESEAALREADRHKNEFLAWLSHELRNPFNVVRGSLALINQTGLDSEPSKRALPGLNRQVALMGRLLDDLLDVTRISKGKIRLQPERTALSELVRAIGEDHREAFDRQGIHFDVLVPGEPLSANVDRARITQVVGNLLQNAMKFTPAAGTCRSR